MKSLSANTLYAGIVGACSLLLVGGAGLSRAAGRDHAPPPGQLAKITIDYPLDGSVFPPEITPPLFSGAMPATPRNAGWSRFPLRTLPRNPRRGARRAHATGRDRSPNRRCATSSPH